MTAKHIFNAPWLPASETHGRSVAGGGVWAGDGLPRAPIYSVPVAVKDAVNETRVLESREDDPDAFARTIANAAPSTLHWTSCR